MNNRPWLIALTGVVICLYFSEMFLHESVEVCNYQLTEHFDKKMSRLDDERIKTLQQMQNRFKRESKSVKEYYDKVEALKLKYNISPHSHDGMFGKVTE